MRRTGGGLLALCCLAALVACAPEPSESPSESPEPSPTSDEVAHASEAAPDDVETSAYERVATGTFVPVDGETTGTVIVTLEETNVPHDPLALVTFTDLSTPHARLGVGGALEPRGEDDPCFDIGIRSGGGDIFPPDHVEPTILPFTGEGWEMTDIVLHTQDTESGDGCINTVVARAALHWTE